MRYNKTIVLKLFLERSEAIWQKKEEIKKDVFYGKGKARGQADAICTVTWIAVANIRRCTVGGW